MAVQGVEKLRSLWIGKFFEFLAGIYMLITGYKVLERRWKKRAGECDLIVSKGDTLAFIEVKYRSSYADAMISWREKQRKNFVKVAESYRSVFPAMQVMLGFVVFWRGGMKHFWLDWRDLRFMSRKGLRSA